MKRFCIIISFLLSLTAGAQDVLMQTGTFNRCEPDIFYDSGGELGAYGSDENLVTTICAQNAGEFIILNFTIFSTQLNTDILTIYDGDDTSATVIGSYSGVVNPGFVQASAANTSGCCLTVEFVSNGTGTTTGWAAEIFCAVPCQTITPSISAIPAVNGSGVIEVLPGTSIDFTGSATFSDDGTGATYDWNFGNLDTATGLTGSSTYNNPGTYTVSFTATDTNPSGCSETTTVSVLVLEPIITINNAAYPESAFSPEELIENVLVSGGCSAVDNFSFQVSGSPNNLTTKSYGYFTRGGAVNFPFEDGIILSTGRAFPAGNASNGGALVTFNNGQAGDADLEAALSQTNTNDATFIKFNFVPTSSNISFRYIMASEEYDGSTECSFADSFAFLLREVGTVPYTNLAVLPDGTPVSVLNINNSGVCTDNPAFFEGYLIGDTNYGGRTVVLTATANVIPETTYEIKLVVADQGDSIWDSAIFLEAGSFILGGELGDDITIAAGNAVCTGESIDLDTNAPTADHVWYIDGVEIVGEIDSIISITEPGTYSVDVVFSGSCQTSDSVVVEFKPSPIANVPPNLNLCDPVGTGLGSFNLTDNDTAILDTQDPADFVITYHLTQLDADNNVGALTSPYNNVSNPETIFVRIADNSQSCFATTFFDLEFSDITFNPVLDLEICDDDSNDGFGSFDLTVQDLGILGAQPSTDFVVTYHTSFADADGDVGALVSPHTNTINPEPIYVRVESAGDPTCYIASAFPVFNLVVNYRALAIAPSDLIVCDDASNDGVSQFDLTTQDIDILNGQDPLTYVVTYYETQADADAPMNVIGSPTTYNSISNPQTIHVRVEDASNPTCYGYTTFNLIVNPLPSFVVPTALEVCDDGTPDGLTLIDLTLKNTEISGNNANYSVTYYLTQLDADSGLNALAIPYMNTSNPQTIYVRVQDIGTGCYGTTTLDLVVEQAPVANTPTPLEYCDPDSDGFGVFTLEDSENEITGGDPALNVSYHETMADADNNVNPLVSPYNNIVANTQTIYVRVESATISTDCATIVELILIVNPTPQIEDPTPLEECDDASADGFAQFDLTSKDSEVLDGLDPLQFIVTYYETQVNADAGVLAIVNPLAYTNTTPFNQILWVRVEDNVNGCYKLTTLELIVNALPVLVQPTPLELCDINNPGDEMEAFTLEDSSDEILNGQTGISLSYYQTQLDADNGTNEIFSPYTNTVNPQTIYVRATNDVTDCVSTITLDLRVNPIPSPAVPTPLEECDQDNDGFASFDLETRTLEIINGELDIVVTYHETQADADNAQNALVSPYNNIVPDTQTIYARAENVFTGCYTVVEYVLNVLPSPVVPVSIEDYVICDTNTDGVAQFDLVTVMNPIIYGDQSTVDFLLTYHLSQGDADSGANPIANTGNYTNLSNPQTLYVRLVSVINGCVTTGFFDIRVELPPTAVQPTPLEICDDEIADELTVFDLTLKDNEITGGQASWSVSYYETDADAQSGLNAIAPADAYTNTSVNGAAPNPQTLYVEVTDTDTGCTDYTTLTIRVLPNPTPSTDPDDLELCDDINPGDAQEEFDLTVNELYIINGESGVTASYHETQEDADLGANAIVDPTLYTNTSTPQTIYVRVTNDITGCYTIVTFDIIVNPLPDVVGVSDLIECELNNDGFYDFDLSSRDEDVLGGQDPLVFSVTYHETMADADNLQNALVSPYTNLTNPQQIFVAITNNITGCSISTQSFNIELHEAAEANSDMEPILYELCDDNMETDGDTTNDTTQFDLTPVSAVLDLDPLSVQAQVLDGQDPANYIVSYYETAQDAEDNVNPLPFLYENTSVNGNVANPQVIYVRVDNDTLDGGGMDTSICYAVSELTLQVNPLPEFVLEESYILCVDTNGTEVLSVPLLDTGLSPLDYSFEWTLGGAILAGETGPSLTPLQGGTYSVTATDNITGCPNTAITEVIESGPPSIEADVTTQAFEENNVIVAQATGLGEYEYSLDNGMWQESGTFTGVSAGEHVITARDTIGCGYASVSVIVMDYPEFLTPNGDGYHDTWNIIGIVNQPSAKIYIFDRYGKLLKQLSPTSQGWNGTYNGELMPTSDYWFVVEYNEPNNGKRKEFKAHFTLKR